jgi:hypothetical protein
MRFQQDERRHHEEALKEEAFDADNSLRVLLLAIHPRLQDLVANVCFNRSNAQT